MAVFLEATSITYTVLITGTNDFGRVYISTEIKYSNKASYVTDLAFTPSIKPPSTTESSPPTESPTSTEASSILTVDSPTKLTTTSGISPSKSLISIGSSLPTQTSLGDSFPPQPSASTDFNSTSVGGDHGGLSPGAKAGIAFGVIIFVLFVVGSMFLFWHMRKSQSGQPDIAGLDMGEIITEPKPKSEPRLKRYFSLLFPYRKWKVGAILPLPGLEPDGAGSKRPLDKEGVVQNDVPRSAISQWRPGLNDADVIQASDRHANEEGSIKAGHLDEHLDGKTSITSHSVGPSNVYVHTPFESHSGQGQNIPDSEELACLEEEAKRIDEEIVNAERLQQLRNERLIIQKRLREARRASSSSLSQP